MNQDSSPYPPVAPPVALTGAESALTPAELSPIPGIVAALEALLRRPRAILHRLTQADGPRLTVHLLMLSAVCIALYGVIIGSFSGGMQYWAAPLKATVGLLICGAICLPSLYVFACLSGSNARFAEVVGMVAGLLAMSTLLLFSFAPVAWVFSQSTESVGAMGALHLLFWLVATYFGARFLRRGMVRSGARSEAAYFFWVSIFVLVALQMSTALRPLIGKSNTFLPTEKKFFLEHWFDSLDSSPASKSGVKRPD